MISSLITSIKIRDVIMKWEHLFPKLEEWAQELEQYPPKNSINRHE